MRTDTEVKGREVLAVWLKGLVKYLPDYEQGKLTQSIKKTKIGKTLEKRDFFRSQQ